MHSRDGGQLCPLSPLSRSNLSLRNPLSRSKLSLSLRTFASLSDLGPDRAVSKAMGYPDEKTGKGKYNVPILLAVSRLKFNVDKKNFTLPARLVTWAEFTR